LSPCSLVLPEGSLPACPRSGTRKKKKRKKPRKHKTFLLKKASCGEVDSLKPGKTENNKRNSQGGNKKWLKRKK
jgi:hypothetical protein